MGTIHAWVTDGQGRVPFKSLFVSVTTLKNRAIVSLLDDYMNGWPLRGDLGDRPDYWLEFGDKGQSGLRERPG